MIALSLQEAQLFRLLTSFFGGERVVPHMRVIAVCGGTLPAGHGPEFDLWARANHCLFTIVNADEDPCLVVEFFSGYKNRVDVTEEQHQRFLRPLLAACSIRYVTISEGEFADLTDPRAEADFVTFMEKKVEESESWAGDET